MKYSTLFLSMCEMEQIFVIYLYTYLNSLILQSLYTCTQFRIWKKNYILSFNFIFLNLINILKLMYPPNARKTQVSEKFSGNIPWKFQNFILLLLFFLLPPFQFEELKRKVLSNVDNIVLKNLTHTVVFPLSFPSPCVMAKDCHNTYVDLGRFLLLQVDAYMPFTTIYK